MARLGMTTQAALRVLDKVMIKQDNAPLLRRSINRTLWLLGSCNPWSKGCKDHFQPLELARFLSGPRRIVVFPGAIWRLESGYRSEVTLAGEQRSAGHRKGRFAVSAKSTPGLFRSLITGRRAHRFRKALSVVVLFASVAALALILQDQNRYRSRESSFRGPAIDSFRSAAVSTDAVPWADAHPEERHYRAIAEFLARKYRVSQDVTFDLVSIAHAAGHQIGLDPLLIIAVIAVESRFNPIAESVSGAKGLMQVVPRHHTEKFEELDGETAIFDPATNILVGAQILKEYLRRTGDLSAALQMYAGALNDAQDSYTSRVMNEKQRLQHVVSRAHRNAPARTAASARSLAPQTPGSAQ